MTDAGGGAGRVPWRYTQVRARSSGTVHRGEPGVCVQELKSMKLQEEVPQAGDKTLWDICVNVTSNISQTLKDKTISDK